jgi:predicted nuclease of predicted toxin-antitoxin system
MLSWLGLLMMKLLLDECIDRRLAREFVNTEVKTVAQLKWASIKNGTLLSLAEKEFDVFVTVDRNLSFQQNIPKFEIAVIVLHAKTNKLEDLKPLVPEIEAAAERVKKGEVTHVGEVISDK